MVDFSPLILDWYQRKKRDLPWRNTKNPYFVWLSEVILQQTRVNQGMNYYLTFTKHYPTVKDLAFADEQEILNDWQGLGYYSRARNLHKTAQLIMDLHDGVFPTTYDELIKLKGIGPYTAAAISSFCFKEHRSVLDGNVFRVLSRIFDWDLAINSSEGKKKFAELAQTLLPQIDSDSYNQAIMEFGALHCVPKNPDCTTCPLQAKCLAFQNKTVALRPVKAGKTSVRKRYFNYLLFQQDGHIVLQKRLEKDIWQHLFQLPLLEMENDFHEHETAIQSSFLDSYKILPVKYLDLKKHQLSHQSIYTRVWFFEQIPQQIFDNPDLLVCSLNQLGQYPVPQLIHRFLEEHFLVSPIE